MFYRFWLTGFNAGCCSLPRVPGHAYLTSTFDNREILFCKWKKLYMSCTSKVTYKLVHCVIFLYLLCVHGLIDIFWYFRDNRLHKLVFNVLLDGTEVAYYVDGQVVRLRLSSGFLQFTLCMLWFIICIAWCRERLMGISRIIESTVITATEWSHSSLI